MNLKKCFKKKKGFTLIEMLVVLFIIGLLSLLVIPNLASQREKATDKTDTAIVRVVEDQYQLYLLNEGETSQAVDNIDGEALNTLVTKKYITQEQKQAYTQAKDRDSGTE